MASTYELPRVRLHIGDSALDHASGGTCPKVFAATGEFQAEIPLAGAEEMNAAVDAAVDAFEIWRRWRPSDRRDVLLKLAQLINEHGEEFSRLLTLDNALPVSFAHYHSKVAAAWTAYYAGWADKLDGQVTSTFGQQGEFSYTLAQPYGVIGIIITWNGPLASLGMKVPAALAAGDTVVIKPSELTPFTGELFMRLVREAGIPAGVVNMVPGGAEAGQALVAHRKVQKISFTGGISTGRRIMEACAPLMKPVIMELGGKSANLIFQDADLDKAIDRSLAFGLIGLSGQACAFGSRLLVDDAIYDRFVERLLERAKAIRVGDPWDSATESGPVINLAAADRIVGMIGKAVQSGAGKLLLGGRRVGGALAAGAFIEPTLFGDVDSSSDIAQREIFGPVMSITRFRTEEEAIAIANSTNYGLSGYLHTQDIHRVHRVAEELSAGGIFVNGGASIAPNTPFGGHGDSGFGREGGRAGIDEFIRQKTVAIGH